MANKLRVLVVGCGHMGTSHARAYHQMSADLEIVGLVSRGEASRRKLGAELGGRYAEFADYSEALAQTRPDAVCISTYSETHADYAIAAMEAGAHVFLEKPVADTLVDCERVIAVARKLGKKLIVGYILHVHPSWQKFTELAQTLGKPLVMRMNLNQQSSGANWGTHKNLLRTTSPIVDCGVHYVDVMCRMTGSRPVRVNGIGARLSDEIVPGQINYGHLQVVFADGSIGWYEAGWGPMMSETAFFCERCDRAQGLREHRGQIGGGRGQIRRCRFAQQNRIITPPSRQSGPRWSVYPARRDDRCERRAQPRRTLPPRTGSISAIDPRKSRSFRSLAERD